MAKYFESELYSYIKQRETLIQEDRALRADHKNSHAASTAEIAADKIVRQIRALEAKSVWAADYPSIPHPFPGMEFLTGRDIITKTKLFEMLVKMPKGALLHAHLDATVDCRFLLDTALEYPAMHVRVTKPLSTDSIGSVLPEFHAQPKELYSKDVNGLTHASYVPGTWVSMNVARATFDPALGGPEGFDRWILDALTINPVEAYQTHNTGYKIWRKFESTFITARGLTRFAPIFPRYFKEFLLRSVEDGISYVEPRVNFWYKLMTDEDGRDVVTSRDMMILIQQAIADVKQELKKQNREDEFIGAKIIYSTLKANTPEELVWYPEDCIVLKKEFPELIAGFDLVGDENEYHTLSYYIPKLLWFRTRQAEEGVDIPFILHAGETLGDGTEADMNLYDAILLGTKRIGHGFSLVKHPKLMEICRERNIALEVCPISNEILRLTSSMPMHPLPILFNYGVPVALSCDDPSVFGNMGLTFDFYQVIVASEITGLIQLGRIARESLLHSMLESEEKDRAVKLWSKRWDEFLDYVIQEGVQFLQSCASVQPSLDQRAETAALQGRKEKEASYGQENI